MKIKKAVEAMRAIVEAYDKIEARKMKLRQMLKGGKTMKFGTVIGIVVGAITCNSAIFSSPFY